MHSDTPEYRQQKADACWAKAAAASTEQECLQWQDLARLWLATPDEDDSDVPASSTIFGQHLAYG